MTPNQTLHRSGALRDSRFSEAGRVYLVTTATIERSPFFADARAAGCVLEALDWLCERGRVDLHAAVVMPDHAHAVVGLVAWSLPRLMHSWKGYSAKSVNRMLDRSGTVWQRQYHDHGIRNERELQAAIEYCLHNPVRAGLVGNFHEYPFWRCKYQV